MQKSCKMPVVTATVLFVLLALVLPLSSSRAFASSDPFKDRAAAITVEIIGLRSARAAILLSPQYESAEVTVELFKKTCGAVAKRVKEISIKEALKIRHAAVKYRNRKNRATDEEAQIIAMFDSDRSVAGKLDRVEIEGRLYRRYSAPIFVEKACLKCHGEKTQRPGFVLKKYPDDRAWGFGVGDLRGIISILSPL
jgi:hypothetical protein